MAEAQAGNQVKVHYTGKLEDGSVFDTSTNREPLGFKLGEQMVIPGFEQAVMGMSTGETKVTRIPAEDAYGPHREEMVVTVPRGEIPDHISPEIGQRLQLMQPSGQPLVVTVTKVDDSSVTLDGNHPLAGQDLTFEIELVEIA